jgi:hypothetical protein
MDWQAHTLTYVHDVLKPPLQVPVSPGRIAVIKNALDPSVISYNGELWVAFQCGGSFRGAATCIAPLDPSTLTINDPQRLTVPIEGGPAGDGYNYSGAPPTPFVFHDRVYVYWAALKIEIGSNRWVGDTIRGMELVKEPSGLRRFWGAGSIGRPVSAHDPNLTVEVAGVDPSDPMSDQSVDLKGIYATENDIYVVAGLGGRGPGGRLNCVNGGGGSYGCFRMQIFHTSMPLGMDILNRQPLKAPRLPFNPTAYDRFFVDDHGQLSVLSYFFPPHRDYNTPNLLPAGLWSIPINLSALKF